MTISNGITSVLALKANRVNTFEHTPDISYLQSISPKSISVTSNYGAVVGNYIISASASSSPITITLPSAVLSLNMTYCITKVDSTSNHVNIASSSGLVAGESSQSLMFKNESISLFSDGTNWQVR